jgi:ATPase subunit of ABC transporter with duplicated ATPase domains
LISYSIYKNDTSLEWVTFVHGAGGSSSIWFKQIREFSGTYDDWYIASTLISKQNEKDVGKKLKEKDELEKFIARFSANASKAKNVLGWDAKLTIKDAVVDAWNWEKRLARH